MSTYTVKAVGAPGTHNAPREWTGQNGSFVDYKVLFNELGNTVVTVTRKQGGKVPAVGESLDGSIDMSGKFGPKFKQDYQAGGGLKSGGGFKGQPKDEAAIKAMWAIGQAVASLKLTDAALDPVDVEEQAKAFYAMVERVKGVPANVTDSFGDGSQLLSADDFPDNPPDDGFGLDVPEGF